MEFKKYNSLENSYRIEFMNKILEEGLSKDTFVVYEKVHGANFALWFDGQTIKNAKRTSFVADNEGFFNHVEIKEKHQIDVQKVFDLINSEREIKELVIFGELFGGHYGHKEVDRNPTAMKVQKGIDYHPDNLFYLFDIKVNGVFLDEDEITRVVKETGFLRANELFRGTLEECLKYPNEFITKLPEIFGLPEIKDNICEGVVIRPLSVKFLRNGSRVIIKNKNDKWTEKAKEPKVKKEPKIYSPEIQEQIENISMYVTENRLKNVLSKELQITQKEFGKLLGLFNKDVIEDYLKEHKEQFENFEKKDRKVITGSINKQSSNLIRDNFQNIIDGNF